MKRSISILVSCALAAATAAAQAPPRLAHGAPWLGHDLPLTLSGAPPFASVRVLESDAAGTLATRAGRLELDPASTRVAGVGTTDADGRFELAIPIPLDPALAETEVHYQALVAAPSAPGGVLRSEAAHLRRLGPRVYAYLHGRPEHATAGPAPGALLILSLCTRELVAALDLGVPQTYSPGIEDLPRPVFTADVSRGALMREGELVFFDPFSGAELERLALPGVEQELALSADGVTAIALEPGVDWDGDPIAPARLHLIDLAAGVEVGASELPRSSTGTWEWDAERDEIYVAEVEHASAGPKYVRRMRLQTMEDLGEIGVGSDEAYAVTRLASAGTSLFVATQNTAGCTEGSGTGILQRIDYAFDPPRVESLQTDHGFHSLTPALELGSLVSTESTLCLYPQVRFWVRDVRHLADASWYSVPSQLADGYPSDTAWDASTGKLWLTWPTSIDGGHSLVWFEPETGAKADFPFQAGPSQVEVVHDALVHVGVINTSTYTPFPTPITEYQLRFVDPQSGRMVSVGIPSSCGSLLGVGIP